MYILGYAAGPVLVALGRFYLTIFKYIMFLMVAPAGSRGGVIIHHHRRHKNHLKMYLHRAYPFPETAEILLQAWFY